jgi:N-methylhydantoinase B/oxoprolinase/acetone carboxylase alpha subunit
MERDPEMVLRDVIDGKVNLKRALKVYGVVVDPILRKVDYGATGSLRRSLETVLMGETH